MTQPDLFGNPDEPPPSKAFDGRTYEPKRDHERLKGQLGRVHVFMSDNAWHTIPDIADAVGGSEASISARLRDFRKEKYGKLEVERRYVRRGLFQYRLTGKQIDA